MPLPRIVLLVAGMTTKVNGGNTVPLNWNGDDKYTSDKLTWLLLASTHEPPCKLGLRVVCASEWDGVRATDILLSTLHSATTVTSSGDGGDETKRLLPQRAKQALGFAQVSYRKIRSACVSWRACTDEPTIISVFIDLNPGCRQLLFGA